MPTRFHLGSTRSHGHVDSELILSAYPELKDNGYEHDK